jgi:hypothetical protein
MNHLVPPARLAHEKGGAIRCRESAAAGYKRGNGIIISLPGGMAEVHRDFKLGFQT